MKAQHGSQLISVLSGRCALLGELQRKTRWEAIAPCPGLGYMATG